MRIAFRSDRKPSEVAAHFAPIANGGSFEPVESKLGGWWDLDEMDDFKLDVLGTGSYALRCHGGGFDLREEAAAAVAEIGTILEAR